MTRVEESARSNRGNCRTMRRRCARAALCAVALMTAATAGVLGTGDMAGAATTVSNLNVSAAAPTSATGGLTTYVVSFKTSGSAC